MTQPSPPPPLTPDAKEDLWRLYGSISDWIKFADAKAGAILAGGGLIAGIVFARLSNRAGSEEGLVVCLSVAAVLMATLSSVLAILVLWPRLAEKEPATLLVYFEHIAWRYSGDRQSFSAAMREVLASDGGLADHLLDQVWVVARIARRKLVLVGYATEALAGTLMVGVIAWAASVFG